MPTASGSIRYVRITGSRGGPLDYDTKLDLEENEGNGSIEAFRYNFGLLPSPYESLWSPKPETIKLIFASAAMRLVVSYLR